MKQGTKLHFCTWIKSIKVLIQSTLMVVGFLAAATGAQAMTIACTAVDHNPFNGLNPQCSTKEKAQVKAKRIGAGYFVTVFVTRSASFSVVNSLARFGPAHNGTTGLHDAIVVIRVPRAGDYYINAAGRNGIPFVRAWISND